MSELLNSPLPPPLAATRGRANFPLLPLLPLPGEEGEGVIGRSIENELADREDDDEDEGVRLTIERDLGPGEELVLLGGINGLRWLSLALRLAELRKRGCDEARFGVEEESLPEAARREASRSSWFTVLVGFDDVLATEKLLLVLLELAVVAAFFSLRPILVPLSLKLKLFLAGAAVVLPAAEKRPLWKCCWFSSCGEDLLSRTCKCSKASFRWRSLARASPTVRNSSDTSGWLR